MKKIGLFLVLLFFLFMSVFSSAKEKLRIDYGPKFLSPSEEVVTPHIKWLKPYTKGPIKVLFITYRGFYVSGMREIVELAQRMDIDYTVFALDKSNIFHVKLLQGPNLTEERMKADLEEKLKDDYNVIVLGNIDFSALPLSSRYKILMKVKNGTSLLGIVKGKDDYLKKATKKKINPEISFLLPYKGLPAFSKYSDFNSLIKSTINISSFGKGKILLLKYGVPRYLQILTPGPKTDPLKLKVLEYDYYLSYIIHLILFSADKEPDVKIKGTDYIQVERESLPPVEFLLESEKNKKVSCFFTLRDKDNKIFISREKKLSLSSGKNRISFKIIKVPAGEYFTDLLVKEGKKTINFGSCFLKVTSDSFIQEVKNIKKSYLKGEEIKGEVTVLTKTGEENLQLKITQRDNFGRVTNEKTIPLEEKEIFKKEASFSFSPTTPLSIIQYIDVKLLKNQKVLDKKRVVFSISNLYPEDDIRYVFWGSGFPWSYLSHYWLTKLYQAGFDTQYTSFSEALPLANLYHIPYATRFVDKKTDHVHRKIPYRKKDDHIRMPCLTDPEYLKKVAEKLTREAKKVQPFSTMEISMGDECAFVERNIDICFSPTCVSKFHKFLKKEYGSLKNLNKEYEATYTSFDEIEPVTFDEAKKNSKLIPLWVDYRRHMEDTWAGIYQFSKDTIRKVIPEAKIGYEGSDPYINSFCAADFYKLMQVMRLNSTYDRPFINYAVADFAKPGTLLGLGWYGGYLNRRNVPYNQYIPWRHLFRGANSFWVWYVNPGGLGSVAASDFSFYDFFKPSIKQVSEIKQGIGKLLISAKRSNDKIALLYSVSSVHSSTLTPELPSMQKVLSGLATLFEDSGYQFQVISYKQLAKGILNKEDFKFLFLPFSQSVSKEEAKEINFFVQKGGRVIADLRPGVSDEHGKAYKKGILDELFGIKQNTKNPEVKETKILIKNANFPERFPLTSIDTSLILSSGKAKAQAGETPVLIVNDYGKGKTILLNFSLSGYAQVKGSLESGIVKASKDAVIIKKFFKSLLSFAGNSEKVKVNPEVPGLRIYRFSSGNLLYLCLLQELPEPAVNYTIKKAKPLLFSDATISLPEKYYIYNIRNGEYLGYTDRIKTKTKPAEAIIYSLLPYKVKGIDVKLPKQIRQRENLEYNIILKSEKGIPGLHIFHISLISPEGKEIKHYSKNLKAKKGKVTGKVSLSLNETLGNWKLKVKDIASGKTVLKNFIVKEQKK